ncbi:MAG: peptidoglycan DD-metalloendopeptidase family protein [Nonlabens sp.]|uniref:peptidoglycan DD-metalloendopeptidase family protein n=1 Tax=Nonlabens sp. TaxID=1888209 RepID=UPI003EF0B403
MTITYIVHPAFFDFILRPSQRTIYERSFVEFPKKLERWNNLFTIASNDKAIVTSSIAEKVLTSRQTPFTAGYIIELQFGETLIAQVDATDSWILEVYDLNKKLLEDSKLENDKQVLRFIPEKDMKVRIVLQAKLETESTTNFKVFTAPRYDFPVAGKGNAAIQSFWGASRGGGSRSHEGNDIFAPKRHPVVAITYGTVSSIRNRGLGGKQVWVKDYDTGYLHYYAHLDEWIVSEGDMVWSGDTLGYIGNTGNAKNTPPHVHFGIYKNGKAVDPKPFIWQTQAPENTPQLPLIKEAKASGFAANLRKEPSSSSAIIQDLKTEPVTIIGNSGNWYHVRTASGLGGFMHQSVVEKQ